MCSRLFMHFHEQSKQRMRLLKSTKKASFEIMNESHSTKILLTIETTFTLGGNRRQALMQVITPYVVPNILDAFRINMAAAWNLVVVAELIAANEGLGKRIAIAQRFFRTDEIFAYLIILGVIGFLADLTLRLILKTTCKWAVE